MKDRIGSKVQLSVKGNVIHFIDIIKSNFLTFEINRAVVSLAIKEVNHKVLQDMTKSGNENLKSLDWAILVRKHTESLLSEIKGLHEKSQINN